MAQRPSVSRVYQSHHLDSARWNVYAPLPGDIVVSTPYKTGTTWTLDIIAALLHDGEDPPPTGNSISEWVDKRWGAPLDELRQKLAEMPAPRVFKSHLPLDGLPFYQETKYIIVGRDPRDVFMSLYHHYSSYTPKFIETVNGNINGEERKGPPIAPCPDIHTMWKSWISSGSDPRDHEGFPYWPNMGHIQSYWEFKRLPNIMFLHYNDMLKDHAGAVLKIAAFIQHEVSDADVNRVVAATTFKAVKERAAQSDQVLGEKARHIFKDGRAGFFHKGKNGRWVDVLTEDELKMYQTTKKKVLTAECATWLEQGGDVSSMS